MRDSYEEKVFFRDVLNVFEADQGNSDAEIRHNGSNGFSKLNGKKRAPSPVPVEFPSGLHKFDFTFLIPVECPEVGVSEATSQRSHVRPPVQISFLSLGKYTQRCISLRKISSARKIPYLFDVMYWFSAYHTRPAVTLSQKTL